jgi:cobalt/nickel transport protein
MKRTNLLLLATVLVLSAAPLLLPIKDLNKPFAGADDRGKTAIVASHPEYKPWFTPLWEPPSGEIVNLMFALQGALGAGLLGYYIGFKRGRAQGRRRNGTDAPD